MKLSVYKGGRVLIEGDAEEVFQHAKRAPLYPFTLKDNQERYEKLVRSEGESSFTGGSYASLFVNPDMTPFMEAKAALAKTGLISKLTQRTESMNRRRRTLSEHDGEWDLSRRWEVQPFARAKRMPVANKIVDIECHLNFSCMVSAEDISRYGCMIWAINDIIESCGISTSIKIISESYQTGNNNTSVKYVFQIKKPGEYINPLYIARTLTSNFHRRIGFSWFVIGCDLNGDIAGMGLGQPIGLSDKINFKDGKLVLTSEAIRNPSSIDIQESIVKAIMGDSKKK